MSTRFEAFGITIERNDETGEPVQAERIVGPLDWGELSGEDLERAAAQADYFAGLARQMAAKMQEGGKMREYIITAESGVELEAVHAATAIEALNVYCAAHPDADTGFQRGGLSCDAETHGKVSASVRTDGGRVIATLID